MANIQFNTDEVRLYIQNLKSLYGEKQVNSWVKAALRGPTATPIKRKLRAITPKRTRTTSKSVRSEIRQRFQGNLKEPALFIGGEKSKGGFVYYFLRGTVRRQTRKGYNRGRIKNLRLDVRAYTSEARNTFVIFRDRLVRQVERGVAKLQARVKARAARRT